jgi:hypothetical protein
MLNADRYFYIGKTHDVCEDFAVAGSIPPDPNNAYAILCDGCSSSKDTDIGARLLVKAAERLLLPRLSLTTGSPPRTEIDRAREVCFDLNLNSSCLDATLLKITALDTGKHCKWNASCIGDGAIIKIRNDNKIEITDIEYKSGAPYYLSYKLDREREKDYIKTYSLERAVTKWIFDPACNFDEDNIATKISNPIIDYNDKPYVEEGFFDDSEDGYHSILITSDGIHSFQQKIITDISAVNSQIGIERILPKLLDFKGYHGQFVARRMKRFMKDSAKWNWSNLDDLSMAGVHYEKD